MKKFGALVMVLFCMTVCGQEKQLWAKSFLNKKAPTFSVEKWLSEKPDLKGKFVLVDFWATWCGPCIKAIPELNRYHYEFKDDLIVIGISDESKTKVNKMKSPVMEYYSAIDTKERLKSSYEVKGIPHCVLIDPNGIVRWEGYPGLQGFELDSFVIGDIIEKYK
ncbi:redoxin domain-containing protein [Algibacter amylolyticus]|uniref:Redoxin domain-containing protein n=1 Tax=Algibacter amylolyticus TaxID=1608400 RepID=A0A5M7BHD5_9FLAO|nr:redoxin domain-containing protein [Algibacter amylolyticus]KAA5827808.1 redoxin domain-containing protein [Algibacter amylolyticus]MBB5267036.1 thiol-disulfide isomerase/thioredoxin [Algibacter amylolyticus]TSJ82053.1 redoxin domain-containing protein [Algibacter amylolyticus]